MTGAVLPFAALVAGFLSFSSPCALPLVPGYLAYLSGLPLQADPDHLHRRVALTASLMFVAGFTMVFTLLGTGASVLGAALLRNQDTVTRGFGVLIIGLGLASLGALRLPFLQRERRYDLHHIPQGPRFAFPLGMAFAAGWVPCTGPILATILATASAQGRVWWGTFLLLLYSLGLGIPFVLLALGYGRATRGTAWLSRHSQALERAGGVMMVSVGLLFISGGWERLFLPLQQWFARYGWPPV